MKAFPLFITVADRPVVVFGGGEEAAAKLRLLLKTEAKVTAVASAFEPAVSTLDGLTRVQQNPLDFTFDAQTPFAYAATGDMALDAELARHARAQGVLVCAADQPAVSDFSTPALVDRDPVVVAIGTEGTAPVLARNIKAQIEFILEPSLGRIAATAAGLRKRVAGALQPGQPRRDFWRAFFGAARAERLNDRQDIERLAHDLLSGQATPRVQGSLTFVGTGSGEADLLAVAGHRALDGADVVLHEPLVSRAVLELARREAVIQAQAMDASESILARVVAGENVVRLLTGSGQRAQDEIRLARAAGLNPRFIPGLAEPLAAPQATTLAQSLSSFLPRKAA